ncbi:MAG: energy transducer TonB [Bacteroidetes bacterium]|nr:MAG: energy transducer TonB [Bacteroidota bacterium]
MIATAVLKHNRINNIRALSQQRNTVLALTSAMGFHFAVIMLYVIINFLTISKPQTVKPPRGIDIYSVPTPSLHDIEISPSAIGQFPAMKTSVGIPIPVPDVEISTDATIPPQTEFTGYVSNEKNCTTCGNNGVISTGDKPYILDDVEEAEPPIWQPVEILPVPIKQIKPEYPLMAQLAGIEGTVWVNCLVDKSGRVKKVMVMKSDSEIFDEPAKQAALQWVFKPAIMNSGAVSVWASIPFRFTMEKR